MIIRRKEKNGMKIKFHYSSKLYHLQKTFALVISLFMLFITLFSVIYMAREAEHSCVNQDCPICQSVKQCENNLKQIGSGAIVRSIQITTIVFLGYIFISAVQPILCNSLVHQKIRFDN